jgi:hypothetical protein
MKTAQHLRQIGADQVAALVQVRSVPFRAKADRESDSRAVADEACNRESSGNFPGLITLSEKPDGQLQSGNAGLDLNERQPAVPSRFSMHTVQGCRPAQTIAGGSLRLQGTNPL